MSMPPLRIAPALPGRRRSWRLVERNVTAYRRTWYVFASGFLEPLLFLLSIGIGVGKLVGDIKIGGQVVSYHEFVAPGLLATAAMTGALFDTTFNFFVKYKYSHTYDAVIATPVEPDQVAFGEITWAVLRGAVYSAAFLLTMAFFGDVKSWWAILAFPGAILISFAFSSAGLAGTTFMRTWIDFDYVNMVMIPMFLFSATFFPISRYPDWLARVITFTPLYQGVVLERSLVLGDLSWTLLLHAAYLAIMGVLALRLGATRLVRLLEP